MQNLVSRMHIESSKIYINTIVGGFSYNRKLKIRRVEKNVKINSSYCQEKVSRPIFVEEIPSLCPNYFERVKLQQDKTNQNPKTAAAFLKKQLLHRYLFNIFL